MTLIEIQNRIKAVVNAHKMVRSYQFVGSPTDAGNEHTTKYPAVTIAATPSTISISRKQTIYSFTMDIIDLVHVAADTKTNELDVVSDMAGIAEDICAQLNSPVYSDWNFSQEIQLAFLIDVEDDRGAGVQLTFSIGSIYTANRCAVPSDEIIIVENSNDIKVYDLAYIATGTEGTALTIDTINGKKILAVIREGAPLHKVSNAPDPAEFTWNDTTITLGVPANPGERF